MEQSLAEAPRRRQRQRWLIGGGLLAAAAAGFFAVALLVTHLDRQLLRDLPVLENFDEYRQIGSFEFLQLLDKEKLFSVAGEDASHAAPAKAEVPVDQRRQLVESMNPGEKEDLRLLQERFASLSHDRQQQLRQLDEELEARPECRASPPPHAALLRLDEGPVVVQPGGSDGDGNRRLHQVDQSGTGPRRRHAAGRQRHGGPAEMDERVCHAARGAGPGDSAGTAMERASPVARHRRVFFEMWQVWLAARPVTDPPPKVTDEDWARLLKALSLESRARLEKLAPPEKWAVLADWARHALQARLAPRGGRGPLAQVDDERLAEFFEKKLSEPERDRLLNLPGEDMQRQLLQLYIRRTRPLDGAGPRSDGQKGRRSVLGGKRTTSEKSEKESPPPDAP